MTTYDTTPDNVPDSIMERIQKILALTTSSNEGEAANALAMAQALLQKYNLDISAVEGHRSSDDLGEVADKHFEMAPKLRKSSRYLHRTRADLPWVSQIAEAVAAGSFCRVVIYKYSVWFIGRTRNMEAAMYMFQNVIEQLETMAKSATQENNKRLKLERGVGDIHHVTGLNHPRIYRESWLLGASGTVVGRLATQRREFDAMQRTTHSSTGAAPVVVTGMEVAVSASDDIDDYMEEKYGQTSERTRARRAAEWAAQRAEAQRKEAEYLASLTPEARAALEAEALADKARQEKENDKYRREQNRREEKYYQKHGYYSWQRRSGGKQRSGPRINDDAYGKGVQDGARVSLDAGKVKGSDSKQIGGK